MRNPEGGGQSDSDNSAHHCLVADPCPLLWAPRQSFPVKVKAMVELVTVADPLNEPVHATLFCVRVKVRLLPMTAPVMSPNAPLAGTE